MNINYIVFDDNGNILKTGVCPEEMMVLQKDKSEHHIIKKDDPNQVIDDIKDKIEKGKIVRRLNGNQDNPT